MNEPVNLPLREDSASGLDYPNLALILLLVHDKGGQSLCLNILNWSTVKGIG